MQILIDNVKLNLLLDKKKQFIGKTVALNDINKLNEISHNHSIIVIKDTFNEFSNRFLVYNDTKWDCKFFLNYKENINNESYIKEHLSNE